MTRKRNKKPQDINLAEKHRPKTIDEFKGNPTLVKSIKSAMNNKIPNCALLHGTYSCGKTTLAEMFARHLNCSEFDYKTIDIAQFSGVDTIREVRSHMKTKPMKGDVKVWIFDECFAKGTQIDVPNGGKPINEFVRGDMIFSLTGLDIVKNVFINKVGLDRIVKLKLSNNSILYTTKEHIFFTETDEKHAINLNSKDLLLSSDDDIMDSIKYLKGDKNEKRKKKTLQSLWSNITPQKERSYKSIQKTEGLLKKMCWFIKSMGKRTRNDRSAGLQRMWKKLCSKKSIKQTGMFKRMWQQDCSKKKNWEKNEKRNKTKTLKSSENSSRNLPKSTKITITKNEKEQPIKKSRGNSKNKRNKKDKWNIKCLAWASWWKWRIYSTTKTFKLFLRMAYGNCNQNRSFSNGQKWVPNKLQNRYREQGFKNCYRNRWTSTQYRKNEKKRQKENRKIGRVGLESIEVYQSGYNDESFSSIIGDKERNQGYVEFYDLEIENHPSYFAEKIAVHNCHKLSNAGQNALLNATEKPPSYCYFFLCTTDPQNVLDTLKSRCVPYKVSTLSESQIFKMVKEVSEKEEIILPKKVALQISRDALGHPRNALKILERIMFLTEDEMLEAAKDEAEKREVGISIARKLMNNGSWIEIAEILKNLKEEPETVRRTIRSYFKSVLLNGNSIGFLVLDSFRYPYYNTDAFNALVRDIYECHSEIND